MAVVGSKETPAQVAAADLYAYSGFQFQIHTQGGNSIPFQQSLQG